MSAPGACRRCGNVDVDMVSPCPDCALDLLMGDDTAEREARDVAASDDYDYRLARGEA